MKQNIILVNPEHIAKYRGDHTKIQMRSSWEMKFFFSLLKSDKVIWFSSEQTVLWYRFKIDDKKHRYIMDFSYATRSSKGVEKIFLCEVKPFCQTQKPTRVTKRGKIRNGRTYARDLVNYIKNLNKWQAALDYCRLKGYEFVFLTDDPKKDGKYKLWNWYELKLPLE